MMSLQDAIILFQKAETIKIKKQIELKKNLKILTISMIEIINYKWRIYGNDFSSTESLNRWIDHKLLCI